MNYTLPAFQSIHFVPADEEVDIRSRPVQAIYIVAHDTLPDGANHWCFYLKLSPAASICINMVPTYSAPSTVLHDGSKGNIILSALSSIYPPFATKTVCLSVCANLTVGRVIDVLVQSGRDKYDFNSEGRGCRMWTTDQIELFERERIITDPVQAAEARSAILTEYPSEKPFPLDVGAYY
ncbi:hypothetical protein V501_01343 [Pseudogymnoascus sp. VKM F-4519 (FW-2642)]|nr:hypothetical protein V501_01343 [Pseudogymnoascus sp. VKM F-4519 (FW-2642)]